MSSSSPSAHLRQRVAAAPKTTASSPTKNNPANASETTSSNTTLTATHYTQNDVDEDEKKHKSESEEVVWGKTPSGVGEYFVVWCGASSWHRSLPKLIVPHPQSFASQQHTMS